MWPGIVLAAILLFREQLKTLISNIALALKRVKKVTAPGTSLEMTEFVAELSEQVEDEVEPAVNGDVAVDSGSSPNGSLDDLTTGKIMRIWGEIDRSTTALYGRLFPGKPARRGFREEIEGLAVHGIITPRIKDSLLSARSIRNKVAHGAGDIPLGTVDDYLRTIEKLNILLRLSNEGTL